MYTSMNSVAQQFHQLSIDCQIDHLTSTEFHSACTGMNDQMHLKPFCPLGGKQVSVAIAR